MKIMLMGDFCPKENTNELFKQKDINTLFGDFLPLLEGNDINFVNIECALTESDGGIEKIGPCLKGTPIAAEVMKEVGINLAGLSNNHIFDYGIQGYKDTVEALDKVGIPYTGFGENYEDSRKNYYFEKNGEKVAFVCVCEHEYTYALEDRMGSRPYDCYDTIADVREAKQNADKVIVIYHGGKENCRYPSPRMRKLTHALVDAGADLVTCQHSHCIGCSEYYKGKFICYGQGNFHFVSPWRACYPHWPYEVVIKYDTVTGEIERIPLNINAEINGIELSKDETLQNTLDLMKELDQSMIDGSYKQGYADYCESVREDYHGWMGRAYSENATERDNKVFGHYLDCEAHLDMLLELNKTANHTNEK